MDNRGGDGYFPSSFIKGFNGSSHERATTLTLYSPVINQCYWPQRNGWIKWDEKSMKGLRDDAYPLDSIPQSKRAKIKRIREDKTKVRTAPLKTWEVEAEQPMETNSYPGQTILLVNHLTNSAANNAVAMVKTLKNGIIIGDNTGSAYTFANVKYYALKNSKIKLWLPSVLLINPDNKMERGFEPDYWLDSADPESEVKKWLENPTTYQFQIR
ncbi:S41 family peptidase [Pedobacter aquatilis]|uniref:S41 family peptidase n=1 Tax=Pedobacter aquatilis TaxID=351343 RepID=UPI0025B4D7B0|nr:S41 family peptidase [Pedobacter aquatilis]MDN3586113.1 S41 family peptidase [Pedobacter aquatilis]